MSAPLRRKVRRIAVLVTGLIAAVGSAAEAGTLPEEHRRWREERVAKLTQPDGWLTLIGLHFLKSGANTVGTAPGHDLVLAAGPGRLGVVTVTPDGRVLLEGAPGADLRVDGRRVENVELQWQPEPTRVTSGTVTFFVIERGGRKALRVKDSAAERRRRFSGLDYFPYDPRWQVRARWFPYETNRQVPVTNILGQVSPETAAGRAVFEHEGRTIELLAIDEGPDAPLFFVIADGTSGHETYGGGRHLYAARPAGDSILLDFNRAENPPCAFTPHSTCPVPPKENRLPFAIRAGEKNVRETAR